MSGPLGKLHKIETVSEKRSLKQLIDILKKKLPTLRHLVGEDTSL